MGEVTGILFHSEWDCVISW